MAIGKIHYVGLRVYLQPDGGYQALATIEREKDAEGNTPKTTENSPVCMDIGEAVAEALGRAGFADR